MSVAILPVRGGQYRAERSGDGVVVHDVPIFGELPAWERSNPEPVGREFHLAALKRAREREKDQYLPPLHICHHGDGEVTFAGRFRLTDVGRLTYEGRERSCLFATLYTTAEVAREIQSGRLQYCSVELGMNWDDPEIEALALLDHEPPHFKFPLITLSDDSPKFRRARGGHVVTFRREEIHMANQAREQDGKFAPGSGGGGGGGGGGKKKPTPLSREERDAIDAKLSEPGPTEEQKAAAEAEWAKNDPKMEWTGEFEPDPFLSSDNDGDDMVAETDDLEEEDDDAAEVFNGDMPPWAAPLATMIAEQVAAAIAQASAPPAPAPDAAPDAAPMDDGQEFAGDAAPVVAGEDDDEKDANMYSRRTRATTNAPRRNVSTVSPQQFAALQKKHDELQAKLAKREAAERFARDVQRAEREVADVLGEIDDDIRETLHEARKGGEKALAASVETFRRNVTHFSRSSRPPSRVAPVGIPEELRQFSSRGPSELANARKTYEAWLSARDEGSSLGWEQYARARGLELTA